ncbi:MAG: hypothetical protein JW769_01935 [Parachlamydiales bacterium]|nr:hypothetical protein [Parachlamydiales bacterium]
MSTNFDLIEKAYNAASPPKSRVEQLLSLPELDIATVPDGMSYVNAFFALYTNSLPSIFFSMNIDLLHIEEEKISIVENVVTLFKKHAREITRLFINFEGGHRIKVYFQEFPILHTYHYDLAYGIGSAQQALNIYNQTSSKARFDSYDRHQFSELF